MDPEVLKSVLAEKVGPAGKPGAGEAPPIIPPSITIPLRGYSQLDREPGERVCIYATVADVYKPKDDPSAGSVTLRVDSAEAEGAEGEEPEDEGGYMYRQGSPSKPSVGQSYGE